jgi:PKD repeat protein
VLTATPLVGLAPLGVGFSILPVGGAAPFTYAWDLGDGTTSTSASFNHTYAGVGVFPVTATVTDSFGTVATRTVHVEVDPTLAITAGALPQNGTAPLAVSFGGTALGGTPGYTFLWTFGDGNASEGQSVVHTYTAPGTYNVALQVWDGAGATATTHLSVVVSTSTVHHPPPPTGTSNSTSAAETQLSLPIALGVSVVVGVAAAVATAVVMRRRR